MNIIFWLAWLAGTLLTRLSENPVLDVIGLILLIVALVLGIRELVATIREHRGWLRVRKYAYRAGGN